MAGRGIIILALVAAGFLPWACRNGKDPQQSSVGGEGLPLPEEELHQSALGEEGLPLPQLAPPTLLKELQVTQAPGEKVTLRYSPGEPVSYDITLSQSSTQKRGEQGLSVGSRQTMVIEQEPFEEGKDGWKVKLKLSNIRIEAGERGSNAGLQTRLEQLAKAMESAHFRFMTNAQGEVLGFEMSGGETGGWSELRDVVEMLVKDSLTILPTYEVAPGDSWETVREETLHRSKKESRVRYALRSTFLGFTTLPALCDRCAVIRTVGDSTITGTITAPGMEGSSSGRGKSDSLAVLDIERGRLVNSESVAVTIESFKLQDGSSSLSFTEETVSTFSQSLKQGMKNE